MVRALLLWLQTKAVKHAKFLRTYFKGVWIMKLMKVLSTSVAMMMVAVMPTTQVMAQNASVESAIDNLNFTVGYEIDKSAPDAAEKTKAAYDSFFAQINALKAQGVSDEEIYSAIEAKTLTKDAAKQVRTVTELLKAKRITTQEAQKQVSSILKNAEATGAHWSSGGTLAVVGITLVVVGLIVLVAASGGSVYVGGSDCYDYWDDCYYWDYYYGCQGAWVNSCYY